MSTWDTDSDEERLRKLLDDPVVAYEPHEEEPGWFFWTIQGPLVGVVWILAFAAGNGTLPAWAAGIVVLGAAGILWLCGR